MCHTDVLSAKARLFVATGTPVAPHSFDGLDGIKDLRCRWVRVPPALFEEVNIREGADTVAGFCEQFSCDVPPEDL